MKMPSSSFAEELARRFGRPSIPRAWTDSYETVIPDRADGLPPPLEEAVVRRYAEELVESGEIRDLVLAAARAISTDPLLRSAAAVASHLLFDPAADSEASGAMLLPAPDAEPAVRLFYAPILLSRVPNLLDLHGRMGVPVNETMVLLRDVERWVVEYHNRHGVYGLAEIGWLRNHFRGRLLQFGRLQYEPCEFEWPYRVYRASDAGGCVVLAEEGVRFRTDGQLEDADRSSHYPPERHAPPPAVLVATLAADDESITGHRVDARTGISAKPTTLAAARRREIARGGSPAIAVHIPASGPLDPAGVADSFRRACAYFTAHPTTDERPRLFTCDSWLMDRQLDAYLPEDSNVVRFQQLFHPVPLPGADDRQHFERVFARPPRSLDDAPRDTTLQRAIVDHVRAGGAWRITGGVMPFDEHDEDRRYRPSFASTAFGTLQTTVYAGSKTLPMSYSTH